MPRPERIFCAVATVAIVLLSIHAVVNRAVSRVAVDAAVNAQIVAGDATVHAFGAKGDAWLLMLEAEHAEADRDACWGAVELLTGRLHHMSYRTPNWRQRVPWVSPDPERPAREWAWDKGADLENWTWPAGVRSIRGWR